MSYANEVLSHYTGAPADVQKALAAALAAAEKAMPAPAPKAAGKAAAAKDPGGLGGAKASETSLKAEVLAYIERPGDLSLSEIKARRQRFANLPDELWETAEEMSQPGATLVDKIENARKILVEVVKLAEAWPGDGPAARIAAAVKPPASVETGPMTFAESRPDVMLAKLANEIRLSEDVDYGQELSLAKQRDHALAKRYMEDRFGGPAPAASSDRPDVELAEKTKARAEKDGVTYSKAMGLELAENPALALRYKGSGVGGAASSGTSQVKTPPGMRLVTERPDVQLTERIKARQERDGVGWSEAERLELSEDPALASRYADWKAGRTAIDEAAYRGETIRAASHGRLSPDKAFSAALAEDPQLRAGVGAYFEKAN